ncbi:MAG: GspH/FimT family pseudopilin [Oleiphilaceae bacterium]|nr:GspH/FimT family pseudopilin [Oleiphilaceae bacterium]
MNSLLVSSDNPSPGFTLIELMVVIAVLAIIATVAVPSFQSVIESNRVTTQANNLLSAIQLTRSEAVKRGVGVSLSADSNDFNEGWCVHTDTACSGTDVLRQFESTKGLTLTSADNTLGFSGRGERIPVTGGNIVIAVQPNSCVSGTVDRRREVTVTPAGRSFINRGDCP